MWVGTRILCMGFYRLRKIGMKSVPASLDRDGLHREKSALRTRHFLTGELTVETVFFIEKKELKRSGFHNGMAV